MSSTTSIETSKKKGKRKGKEHIIKIEDTKVEYIEGLLHGSTPPFGGLIPPK
jgi:hypothetical protein